MSVWGLIYEDWISYMSSYMAPTRVFLRYRFLSKECSQFLHSLCAVLWKGRVVCHVAISHLKRVVQLLEIVPTLLAPAIGCALDDDVVGLTERRGAREGREQTMASPKHLPSCTCIVSFSFTPPSLLPSLPSLLSLSPSLPLSLSLLIAQQTQTHDTGRGRG
jgi:hypothetical protein